MSSLFIFNSLISTKWMLVKEEKVPRRNIHTISSNFCLFCTKSMSKFKFIEFMSAHFIFHLRSECIKWRSFLRNTCWVINVLVLFFFAYCTCHVTCSIIGWFLSLFLIILFKRHFLIYEPVISLSISGCIVAHLLLCQIKPATSNLLNMISYIVI